MDGPLVTAFRDRAARFWCGLMSVESSRGSWDGQSWDPSPLPSPLPQLIHAEPKPQLLAALTRASIRPAKAMAFWKHGCLLAAGLGEAPLLRQATFSLWRSEAAMDAYARSGAHLEAIRAAARHRFFTESLFMRFVPLQVQGTWQGRSHDLVAAA